MSQSQPKMGVMINKKIPATWSGREEKCRGCGKTIGWALTENRKWLPFDLDDNCTAHWATCKNADDFRRKARNH